MTVKRKIIVDGDVAHIPLTQGKVAIIDTEDIGRVSQYSWCTDNTGYALARINGKRVYMHRWLLGLNYRSQIVDHINGNKLDNRRSNMKVCSYAENLRNKAKYDSGSGYRGLRHRPKLSKSWRLYTGIGNKLVSLGYYANNALPAVLFDCVQIKIANALKTEVSLRVLNFPDVVDQLENTYDDLLRNVLTDHQYRKLNEAIENLVSRSNCDRTSVYLAKRKDEAIKIGVSRNPEKRIAAIRSGFNCKGSCPSTELIFSIELSTAEIAYSVEKQLHDYFANDRITGEWFKIDQSAAIAKLKELVNNSRFSQR
jgi:predicted GIY-YIG superfamily endonuclease